MLKSETISNLLVKSFWILFLFWAMAANKSPPALVDPTVVVVVVISGSGVVGGRVGRVGAGLVVNCSVVVSENPKWVSSVTSSA